MIAEHHPSLEPIPDAVYALAGLPGSLYAARGSGLYRSYDGGATWQNTFDALGHQTPLAAVAVAVIDQTVFAGSKGAVFRSTDAGASWQISALPSPPPLVVSLAPSPCYHQDGIILAGTAEDGVLVSDDRGETWIPWNFGLVDTHVYALAISPAFDQDRTVFAGTESGIFRSYTGGRSWREVPFPMDAAPVLSLGLSPDGLLYAGTENQGLFVSGDFGQTWQPLPIERVSTAIHAIHITPQPESLLLVLLEDGLAISKDGGQSWNQAAGHFNASTPAMTMLPHYTTPGHILVGLADGRILSIAP